jgi:hypothetical protein
VTTGEATGVSGVLAAFWMVDASWMVVVSPSVISEPETTDAEPLSSLSTAVSAPIATTALAPAAAETSLSLREFIFNQLHFTFAWR